VSFDPASRSRLSPHDLHRFEGDTLFARIARTLCEAECVPRKELFEAWEVARRARRRFRGGRVLDLACGHALVAHIMLLLDDTSPSALAVDRKLPPSAFRVAECLSATWPRLAGRVSLLEAELDSVAALPGDVLVSCHACGRLTDDVIDKALEARAALVVLPCCQSTGKCDLGGLAGWLDPALAIDVTRAAKLRAAGYHVHTQTIPAQITPKNRLLLGAPPSGCRVIACA
jgi:Methyltransferase domain